MPSPDSADLQQGAEIEGAPEPVTDFVENIPAGAYYVLSRESAGIDFSGSRGKDAKALSAKNFERIKAMTGLSLAPKDE